MIEGLKFAMTGSAVRECLEEILENLDPGSDLSDGVVTHIETAITCIPHDEEYLLTWEEMRRLGMFYKSIDDVLPT